MKKHLPLYIDAYASGLLDERIEFLSQKLECCTLCPRKCGKNRKAGETGVCSTGESAVVASFQPHFGEEAPLVGHGGSGTIFFTHCNLLCNFCQNSDISHQGVGVPVSTENLADMMMYLKKKGCLNINFVTPTHVVPQILSALKIAIKNGLDIPLVYNTGAYDLVQTLEHLEGIIDIYMPDFKFWEAEIAERCCDAPDYRTVVCNAIKEMHRQVGDLLLDEQNIAYKGLLVRHLVLPHGLAGTRQVMRFLKNEISVDTYVNIMSQYRPCGKAHEDPQLAKCLVPEDFRAALRIAEEEGVFRIDKPGW